MTPLYASVAAWHSMRELMVKKGMLMNSYRPLLQLYPPHNMLLYTDKTQQTAVLPRPACVKNNREMFQPPCNDLAVLCACMSARVCGALPASTVHQCLPPDRQATDTAPRGRETFSITPSLFPLCQVAERRD